MGLTLTVIPLYAVLGEQRAAAGAADAAALAAADVRVGIVAGEPCAVARRVAEANGAQLRACECDGLVATVVVSKRVAGFDISAAATAGPPREAEYTVHE